MCPAGGPTYDKKHYQNALTTRRAETERELPHCSLQSLLLSRVARMRVKGTSFSAAKRGQRAGSQKRALSGIRTSKSCDEIRSRIFVRTTKNCHKKTWQKHHRTWITNNRLRHGEEFQIIDRTGDVCVPKVGSSSTLGYRVEELRTGRCFLLSY